MAGAALLAWAGGAAVTAAAADGLLLRDYRHTAWTANEGAPSQIAALAQTPDGWLWLGTADGLYRFDGVAFEDVALPPRGMLSRAQVVSLHAAPNGDLWIAYPYGGLAVRRADGRIEDIAEPASAPPATIGGMAVDRHGVLWVISVNGLYQVAPGSAATGLRRIVDGAGWSRSDTRSLRIGRDGTLWATYDNRVWRQDPASGNFVAAGPAGVGGSLARAPDGDMWAQRGAALAQVGAPSSGGLAEASWSESSAAALFDRNGNLWQLAMPRGACRLAAAKVHGAVLDAVRDGECMADAVRITSPDTEQVLEDREGNVWIATQLGLDRYQPNRVRHSGLAGSGTSMSLAADADGVVWAANASDGALWRLAPGSAPVRQPGRYARVVGTARDGALLIAGRRTIERRLHGVVTQIPLPPGRDGKPADLTMLGTLDDGKVLWIASLETGLMGRVNGVWQPRSFFRLPPRIVISAAGAPGELWIADGDGGLSRYDDGKLTRIDATSAGLASALFASPDVMVAGERGLAVLQHGTMRLLRSDADDTMRNISGMVITPDGDRWFNGIHGVVHVRAADWQYAMTHPDARLRTTLEGGRDGYPGQAAILNRLPTAVQGAGQLWFAATGGVVRIDPSALRENLVAPVVQISHVATPLGRYAATAGTAHLPPASGSIGIAFTAPALRRPEQVRYSWRLDGVEHGWVDGGNRRVANYSNLGPGRYRFHVRATNEDGVPGAAEAVQDFVIAPTLVQSAWFKAMCAMLLVLLGVALYHYRIRVLTARLSAQMQVRASERERIARTLHDTYLQSVHALLLRVGAMAQELPAGHPLRARLETVLADASDAVVEGREQVEQLRAGSPAALAYALEDTIENVLARAAGPLRQCYPGVTYAMQVTGVRRALAAPALDEAGQIASEALRNAFIHAGASQIDVTVDYGAAFSVRVQDDGKGLDDTVRSAGYRSGHWGLLGMRERARDLGAALAVDSQPGHGTAVLLTVPGERAYAPVQRPGWRARWLRR